MKNSNRCGFQLSWIGSRSSRHSKTLIVIQGQKTNLPMERHSWNKPPHLDVQVYLALSVQHELSIHDFHTKMAFHHLIWPRPCTWHVVPRSPMQWCAVGTSLSWRTFLGRSRGTEGMCEGVRLLNWLNWMKHNILDLCEDGRREDLMDDRWGSVYCVRCTRLV